MMTEISDNIGYMVDVMNTLRPTVGEELFHYVSMDKSIYTLQPDGDINCGHSNFMNDHLESWQGVLLFLKYIRKNLTAAPYQVLETNLRENSAMAKLNTSGYSYFMPYIFCVMPEKDSAYQWRNYTDRQKGGYCFAFNLDLLRETIKCRNARYGSFSSMFLAPCFYIGKDDDLIDTFMDTFINVIARSGLKNIEASFLTEKGIQSILNVISAILTLAPLFKDKRWNREQEYRLILKKAPVIVGERYVRSHLSDICGHPLNLMSAITISPHGNQAELLQNLRSRIAIPEKRIFASSVNRRITDYYITKEEVDSAYEEYVLGEINNGRGNSIISQEEYRSACSEKETSHA